MSEEMIPLKLCVDLLMANSTYSASLAHSGFPHLSVRLPQHMAQANNYQDLQTIIEQAVREMAKGASE